LNLLVVVAAVVLILGTAALIVIGLLSDF